MQKDSAFLRMAEILGELGTCPRGAVGALIVRAGRCVSWGYNGAAPGMPHCTENYHGWWAEYPGDDPEPGERERWAEYMASEQGCRNVIHAEANALAFAARQGISTEGGTCYVTLSPCVDCARLLVAAGIRRVVWLVTYRLPEGADFLRAAGVEIG